MTTTSSPKISVQYRTREGKMYEFASSKDVVCLSISNSDDARGEKVWHAQAKTQQSQAAVDGWGSTAAAALEQVASVWHEPDRNQCSFDWAAAGDELRRVRAI